MNRSLWEEQQSLPSILLPPFSSQFWKWERLLQGVISNSTVEGSSLGLPHDKNLGILWTAGRKVALLFLDSISLCHDSNELLISQCYHVSQMSDRSSHTAKICTVQKLPDFHGILNHFKQPNWTKKNLKRSLLKRESSPPATLHAVKPLGYTHVITFYRRTEESWRYIKRPVRAA